MTELTPIVVAVAALVSTVYGVTHGNIGALFNLLSPILQLRTVDFTKLKADLAALSPTDRATLDAQFDAALSIPDPTVLKQLVSGANILDGAVSLAEDVVTSAVAFYGRALSLWARLQALFAGSPTKAGVALPPWLHLPSWLPSWLVPTVLSLLTSVILPALAAALPAEAPLINDLIAFLKGGVASSRLRAAHAHFHGNP